MNVTKTLLTGAVVAATGLHPVHTRATEYQGLPGPAAGSAGMVPVSTGSCLPGAASPLPRPAASEPLQLEVLFETGDDQLSRDNHRALGVLARFLLEYPHLAIRLDGFADPRGTDEYNNVLSDYRARAVQEALIAAGIAPGRIERRVHGAGLTRATAGNYQSYALERRVDIHIYNPAEHEALAAITYRWATAIQR